MRQKRKRRQREEVRKILHAMRLELAARRLAQEQRHRADRPLALHEAIAHATHLARSA